MHQRKRNSASPVCQAVSTITEVLEPRLLLSGTTASGRPLGVDVAHFQGTINWTTVMGSKDFAYIKSTGSDPPASGDPPSEYTDGNFSTYANNARTAGMLFGTYHFADPNSTTSATAQADYFVTHGGIAMEDGNLPPVLDLEEGSTNSTTISNWVNAFCYEVYARIGVKPLIYASSGTYAEDVNSSVYNTWKLWVANYGSTDGSFTDTSSTVNTGSPPSTGNWPTWTAWQYNSVGSVSGIQNGVDSDVFSGTLAQLQAMEISNQAVVQNGSTYIASGGGTDNNGNAIVENYGTNNLNGTAPSMTFTIENEGATTLNLGSLTVPNGYTITDGLNETSLPSLGTDTITVKLNTGTLGTFAGNITFTTNDPDTPTFKIPVTGTVMSPPVATVLKGTINITDGQTTPISFASVTQGATSPSVTFTVRNSGGSTLTLSGLTVPTPGYSITDNLVTSLAPGAFDNFTVALSTGTVGTFSGNVSFTNNASNENPFSFAITGTVNAPVPAAPTNLQLTSNGSGAVSLSWTDNSNNETEFVIDRQLGSSGGFSQAGMVDANVTTFTDNQVQPGTSYTYEVAAATTQATSAFSNTILITTLAATPTGLSASDGAFTDHVALTWNAASGATKYQVYRSTTNDPATASLLAQSSTTSYDDAGATPNVPYYYWVAAFNSANVIGAMGTGDSGFSDTIPPTVVSDAGSTNVAPPNLSFTFSEGVGASIGMGDLSITNLDSVNGPTPTVMSASYDSSTQTANFVLASSMPEGNFQAALSGVTDAAGNALSGPNTLDFFFLPGDANGDRVVNATDFAALASHYGQSNVGGPAGGDFDFSGTVDGADFNILSANFGKTLAPPPDSSPPLGAIVSPANLFSSTLMKNQSVLDDAPVSGVV